MPCRLSIALLLFLSAFALCGSAQNVNVFINELHYDNDGGDTNEAVEIAGPGGTDLSGWQIVLYNGSDSSEYETINLSGSIDDEGCGFGAVSFYESGIQNGDPDGLALVDHGTVIQFLSYEGTFTATGGPANGMTSTDIGVEESGSTQEDESLQLTGNGTTYGDFTWQAPSQESMGDINTGQDFCGGCPITINSATPTEGPVNTTITLNGSGFSASGGVQSVTVGGQSATFNQLSGTELEVTIPSGAGSGSIAVDNETCAPTFEGFTLLGAHCAEFDDLIISEMFNTPSDGDYIEIYNGTGSAADLSNYDLTIHYNSFNSNKTLNLSGTLNDGEAYVIQCSNNDPQGVADTGPGSLTAYNDGEDCMELEHTGSVIDRIGLCESDWMDSNDITYRSKPNREPNSSGFDASDWFIGDPATSESDLGTAFGSASPPGFNSQDYSALGAPCDNIEMEADFSGTNLSYQWFAIGPGEASWSALSNSSNYSGVNTSTLMVNESFELDGYQYYAQVINEGTCVDYSEAIPLSVEPRRYYRSRADGNWGDVSTWEYSPDGSSNWEDACKVPTDVLADEIAVGHEVSITSQETKAPRVVIKPTGFLDLASSSEIFFKNQPGSDFVIEGTFIDRGSSPNGPEFADSSATWSIASSGTLIKTNRSSATEYRDNYEGGIAAIPADATWIYRHNGQDNITFASSSDASTMHYPNLILENSEAASTYSSVIQTEEYLSTFAMVGDDPIVIKGNFEIGNSGAGNIDFVNINHFSNPVEIRGDLIIGSGSTLRNHDPNDSLNGTGFSVDGDVIADGTLDLPEGNGELKLDGNSSDQNLEGIGTVNLAELSVDKSDGDVNIADLSPTISSLLKLIDGVVYIDSDDDHLLLTNTATVNATASDSSHVNGFIYKQGNSDFRFPVGDKGNIKPLTISDMEDATTFKVRYTASPHPSAPPYFDGDNYEISHCDYWSVNPTLDTVAARVTLNYGGDTCTVVEDYSYLGIASYVTLEDTAVWLNPIDPGVDPDETEPLISSAGPTTDWGDLTLSSKGGDANVLPVEWLYFKVANQNGEAVLNWATGSEINNRRFVVERSSTAQAFTNIGSVPGAGTVNHMSRYEFRDSHPLPGSNYYRIRQVDYDGRASVSTIHHLRFTGNYDVVFDVLPGPSGWRLNFRNARGPVTFQLFTASGRLVYQKQVSADSGNLRLNASSRGVYFLKMQDRFESLVEKLHY